MGDHCKPETEAFETVLKFRGDDDDGVRFEKTVFFEDSVKNLAAAKRLGMTTVLIRSATAKEEGHRDDGFVPDHVIDAVDVPEIRRILPGLFE